MEKTEISGYDLSHNWFDWCFENPEAIKPIHTALYFFIIEHCNRLGWKEKFGLPTGMTMDALGVKNYKTYSKALSELVKWGFIKVVQKSQNQYSSCIIAIVKSSKANTKALSKARLKHSLKQVQSTVQSTTQSTVVIDKLYNNELINKRTHSKERVGVSEFLIDYDKLGEYFNTQLSPPMPKILLPISKRRITAVEAMAKEYGKDKVVEMFSIASKSKFLHGSGPSGWVASFDWMFKPGNFVNILEGSYLGSEKKDIATKSDKAYLDRIRKSEEHQKHLDEIARTATLPPKGLSINRIDNK